MHFLAQGAGRAGGRGGTPAANISCRQRSASRRLPAAHLRGRGCQSCFCRPLIQAARATRVSSATSARRGRRSAPGVDDRGVRAAVWRHARGCHAGQHLLRSLRPAVGGQRGDEAGPRLHRRPAQPTRGSAGCARGWIFRMALGRRGDACDPPPAAQTSRKWPWATAAGCPPCAAAGPLCASPPPVATELERFGPCQPACRHGMRAGATPGSLALRGRRHS